MEKKEKNNYENKKRLQVKNQKARSKIALRRMKQAKS